MDYEQDEQEEQFEEQAAEPQAEDMEIDEDDALYLDLRVSSLRHDQESKLWSYQSFRSGPPRENRYGR